MGQQFKQIVQTWDLRVNIKSGITVSLVSLPLSISLAIAANATPLMGVVTAVWAGLFAAIFGGSKFNIVGPTGALSGLLAVYALKYGVSILPILAILSGFVTLLFFAFRVEKYLVFIPSSVVHGFTLGVAFIISLNQLNFILGLSGLAKHEKFIENVVESLRHIGSANLWSVGIFAVGIALLFGFLKYAPKVPGVITVAVLGILLGIASDRGVFSFALQTLATKYGTIPATIFAPVDWSLFSSFNWSYLSGAVAIAVIAVLETLISGKIADGMKGTRMNARKEVFGLGIANIVSGLFGGIPATAALARTALNVKSGATHQSSAAISSVAVALIALVLLPWFKYLPLPVVASILVYVAIRMVTKEHLSHLYRIDKYAFLLCLVVAAITIVEDPIIGILIGAVVALLRFAKHTSQAQCEITVNKNKEIVAHVTGHKDPTLEGYEGDVYVYRFSGPLTYVNGQMHLSRLESLISAKVVILNLRQVFYIDIDGLEALTEIVTHLQKHNTDVVFTGVNDFVMTLIKDVPWFVTIQQKGRVFARTSQALKTLGFSVLS